DGTPEGTVLVKDIKPGSGSSYPNKFVNINGTLYFTANSRELWKSDGTTEGTVLVEDPGFIDFGSPEIININGTFYFIKDDGIHGKELWKSDGTQESTVLVKDINPGAGDSFPNPENADPLFYFEPHLTNVNGILYFFADDGTHGGELWKSDGTENGTVLVKDINAGSRGSVPSFNSNLNIFEPEPTNVNGILYFLADDGIHGGELWASDGTPEGTVLVKDSIPGADGLYPSQLTNVDGILYFTADDGINGRELWALNTNPTVFNSTVSISAIDTNAVETDNSPASFRISRTGDTDIALAVKYTIDGTATNGIDYTQLTGIASLAVGQSFADVTITPVDDGLVESSETVTLTLTTGIDYDLDTSYISATATIIDSINIINGGGSRDPLTGTDGSDKIVGGTGSKTITGGAGNDQFVYTSMREVGHRITDFTVGSDKIVLIQLLDSLVHDGYNGSDAFADGYVRLVQGRTANSTIVQIDRDGLMGSATFRPFIQLDNVTPQAMNNINNFVF
ncbi:ELWxxDGT repeat protein, partial [Halotia wernerae UHCC 0503]|nr:ELWxxDGT repeat protein [Halotia wernerae UHCC 0503]